MKYLKTYQLFESRVYDKSIIRDMLLDYTDEDITVNVSDGVWILNGENVEWFGVSIRSHNEFTVKDCIFDVIDYLESRGMFPMSESWFWNYSWQNYIGCPKCLSDDIEDNYQLRGKTQCNNCSYFGPPDAFLTNEWPVDRNGLEEAARTGKRINEIELTFSKRKSLYEK